MTTKHRAQELDVVRLLVDLPEHGLSKGEEGTVLLVFDDQPEHYLVEFADREEFDMPTFVVSAEQIELVWSFAEHQPKADQRVEETPENKAKTHFEAEMICLNNGLLDEAKEEFRRAVEIDPRYAGILTNAALPLGDKKCWDQAAFIFRIVLLLQPDRQTARENLARAYLNRGVEQARRKQYEAALTSFYETLKLDVSEDVLQQAQTNLLAVYNKLAIELASERQFEEAVKYFNAALQLSPAKARRNWAIFLVYRATFNEIAESDQPHESLEEVYNPALQAGLDLSDCYNVRGAALAHCGKLTDAEEAFKKACQLDPQNEIAGNNLLRLQEELEKEQPEGTVVIIPLPFDNLGESQPLSFAA